MLQDIRAAASSLPHVKIMHVCGTHEQSIVQYGLRSLLPDTVEIIAGPDSTGIRVSHQARFLDMYAGCLIIEYGPRVTIPLCVKFEHLVPNAKVALR